MHDFVARLLQRFRFDFEIANQCDANKNCIKANICELARAEATENRGSCLFQSVNLIEQHEDREKLGLSRQFGDQIET